jgi:hypothetical protein
MATLNGVGTKFHGFKNTQPDGTSDVTLWFVLLYFPVLPLRAYRIRCTETERREIYYTILERIPMDLKSILTTYFFGWIVTPVLWFWPMPFAVREVGEYFGYTNENAEGGFYTFVIVFAIAWLIVFAWKWKDWDERRGLPVQKA